MEGDPYFSYKTISVADFAPVHPVVDIPFLKPDKLKHGKLNSLSYLPKCT
jgi:hypothetical protein